MKWWPPWNDRTPELPSEGYLEAQEALESARKHRQEVEELVERHRKVRRRNHLGPAAADTLRKGRGLA